MCVDVSIWVRLWVLYLVEFGLPLYSLWHAELKRRMMMWDNYVGSGIKWFYDTSFVILDMRLFSNHWHNVEFKSLLNLKLDDATRTR